MTTIKQVQHPKYLGDLINSQGNNCDLIKSRIHRSYGSVTELISIGKEAYFGSKQIEIMLLLYRSVYLPRLIYNCESWSKLTKNYICELQKAQRRFLRSIMEVPGSTPVAATYLELGVLPIEYEIDIRRLRFLWTILQKNNDDPVRMVYTEMLKYPFEENWANDVIKLRCKYGLSMDDASVETTGINEWKYLIKSSVKNYALRCLTKACSENKKTQHLEFDKLNESPYLTALSPQTARIIFKERLGVFDIKVNFKDKYSSDLSCAMCKEGRETLEHILQCRRLPVCKARETLKVDSLFNRYVAKPLKRWGKFLKFYLSMKEVFLTEWS